MAVLRGLQGGFHAGGQAGSRWVAGYPGSLGEGLPAWGMGSALAGRLGGLAGRFFAAGRFGFRGRYHTPVRSAPLMQPGAEGGRGRGDRPPDRVLQDTFAHLFRWVDSETARTAKGKTPRPRYRPTS